MQKLGLLYARWLETLAAHADAPALTDAGGRKHRFRDLAEQLETLPQAVAPVVADTRDGVRFVLATLCAWRDGQPFVPVDSAAPDPSALENLPDTVAHVKMTSGSTGAPRLVLFRAEQIAADADNIVTSMGLRHEWPNVGVISMAHSYGFSNLVLPLLLHGIPLVLAGDALPVSVSRALALAPGGATLPAVPAMWKSWLGAGILSRESVRLAVSAGAPLTAQLERTVFEATGIKIHNFLGSSECGGIAYDRSETPRSDGRHAGTAMDNVSLDLAADGCLKVSGAAVGEGYWPEDDDALCDGVFRTQDQGTLDERGQVILEGRLGDVINVAGRKISPAVIEAAIAACPEVGLCVVFGIPSADPERVQEIAACLRPAAESWNATDFLGQVKKSLRGKLPSWQQPRHWRIEPELGEDFRGKVSRHRWRERFLARSGVSSA